MPKCFYPKCTQVHNSINTFRTHLRSHGIDASSAVYCIDGNCKQKMFANLSSFVRHFQSIHMNDRSAPEGPSHPLPASDEPGVEGLPSDNEMLVDEERNDTSETVDACSILAVKDELDLFVSKLYCNPKLPRNAIQSIVEFSASLVSVISSSLEPDFSELAKTSTNTELCSRLKNKLSFLSSPFLGLHSEYMRLKTYEDEGTFIPPEICELKAELIPTATSSQAMSKNLTAAFIPLRKQLKALLELPGVMKKIFEFRDFVLSHPEVIMNVMSSKRYQDIVKTSDKLILPLFLFADEFETGNCLGSLAGIHKITGVYVNLPFIPPEFYSIRENILVTYLHHSNDKSVVKTGTLYQRVIDEFVFLIDKGISIESSDYTGKLYFSLSSILGDNLGVHQFTGFAGGFNANYPCRMCKVPRLTMTRQCRVDPILMRTVQNYLQDVALGDLSQTGIAELCVWNVIPDFHCVLNTAVDIMHDIFEGCCIFDFTVILNFLLKNDYLTLDYLNNRIHFFNYGLIDSTNKPPLLTVDRGEIKIKMSAAQMAIFTRYFGLLVGDLIPEGEAVWQLYISLRRIVDIILSPVVTREKLSLLSSYVAEHHELYLRHSPDSRLKPKHHHMLHYEHIFEMLGPLIYIWCMGDEQKHQFNKAVATAICTRIDLTQSIAMRLQMAFRSQLKSQSFLSKRFKSGPTTSCSIKEEAFYEQIKNEVPDDLNEVEVSTWVEVNGTEYKKDMIVVVGNEDFLPVFCKIFKVIADPSKVSFICTKVKTLYFDEHYFCHRVELLPQSYCFVKISDLTDVYPTDISLSSLGNLYVTYKYGL